MYELQTRSSLTSKWYGAGNGIKSLDDAKQAAKKLNQNWPIKIIFHNIHNRIVAEYDRFGNIWNGKD